MVTGQQTMRAAELGVLEYRNLHTVPSWLFGWCLRLVCQVLFFSMIGVLLGDPEVTEYLLVGNIVAVAALEATTVVVSMAREHHYGTLAMLVASPGDPVVALVVGNLNWPATGLLSAMVTGGITVGFFGVSLSAAQLCLVVPLTLLCAVSAFCFGAAVGAALLNAPSVGFTAMNLTYLSLMTFTGVNVPVDFWPGAVRWAAQLLPVTHGLAAVRAVLSDGLSPAVVTNAALETLVGATWLAVTVLAVRFFLARWRRRGGLDFPA